MRIVNGHHVGGGGHVGVRIHTNSHQDRQIDPVVAHIADHIADNVGRGDDLQSFAAAQRDRPKLSHLVFVLFLMRVGLFRLALLFRLGRCRPTCSQGNQHRNAHHRHHLPGFRLHGFLPLLLMSCFITCEEKTLAYRPLLLKMNVINDRKKKASAAFRAKPDQFQHVLLDQVTGLAADTRQENR